MKKCQVSLLGCLLLIQRRTHTQMNLISFNFRLCFGYYDIPGASDEGIFAMRTCLVPLPDLANLMGIVVIPSPPPPLVVVVVVVVDITVEDEPAVAAVVVIAVGEDLAAAVEEEIGNTEKEVAAPVAAAEAPPALPAVVKDLISEDARIVAEVVE